MSEIVEAVNWVKVAAVLSAGICMGIGAMGPALGQGYIGAHALKALSKNPEQSSVLMRVLYVSMAFVESSSIYALLIALILLLIV